VKCLRCGRELKNEKAIERGYGYSCFQHTKEQKVIYKTLEDYYDETRIRE
jgi:DNA-directed RNA polymerase subunit RPC12/RpoP